MGNEHEIIRKIIIMTFDDSYLKDIYNIITKQKMGLIDDTGYFNYEDKNTNVIYTFLSEKIKRSWYHHFMGTYGAIIINEGNNFSDNMKEINNILNSEIILKKPILIVYDKNKILKKDNRFLEDLRYNFSEKKIIYNIIYIDFKINHSNSELFYGLDWLYKQIMKIV